MSQAATVIKHVVIEEVLPGRGDAFAAAMQEANRVIAAKGWRPYRVWRASSEDETEQLFGLHMFASPVAEQAHVLFEADFDDRAQLDEQLEVMLSEPEFMEPLARAAEHVVAGRTRTHVYESVPIS